MANAAAADDTVVPLGFDTLFRFFVNNLMISNINSLSEMARLGI